MANPKHTEILQLGVETWNQWREENPNVRPDLNEIQLFEEDLSGVDLQETDLFNASLRKCTLRAADLRGADLRNTNLVDGDLGEADLSGASLHMANLQNAGLQLASLQCANLIGANLKKANLISANLTDSDVLEADLSNANLMGATLFAANLTGVKFDGADLSGTDLREAVLIGADLTDCTLIDADLSEANVSEVRYERPRMRGKYKGIRADICHGNLLFRRDAQDQSYLDTLEGQQRTAIRQWMFNIWAFFDYGRSFSKILLAAFTTAIAFGLFYWADWLLGSGFLNFEMSANSWLSPWFYSFLTFTLVGFANVTPVHWIGELIVVLEGIIGYLTLALLLGMVARTLYRRT